MPKISELNAITSVANNDLLMVVHDPSGLPSTNKITVNNFVTSVSTQLRGYTGSFGTTGFTGSLGGVGFAGSSGSSGFTGSAGSAGYTGSIGSAGTTGYTGSAGSSGYTGSEGTGYTGSEGASGAAGSTGYTGSEGAPGAGYTGSEGAAGTAGYTGSAGSAGSAGYTGSLGVIGFTGSAGSAGSAGYTGSEGGLGYTGSAGNSNQTLDTTSNVAFASMSLLNGDDQNGSSGKFQISFGYNGSNIFQQFISTRHNTSAVGNAIEFYTSDGTSSGLFPNNGVLGLVIENGDVSVPGVASFSKSNSAINFYSNVAFTQGPVIISGSNNITIGADPLTSINYTGVYVDTSTNGSEYVSFYSNSVIYFYTDTSNNSYAWQFNQNGTTQFPNTIIFPNGTSIDKSKQIVNGTNNPYGDVYKSGGATATVWTASNSHIISARVTVRVQSDMNARTELFTAVLVKDSGHANVVVVERITSNTSYGASTISGGLNGNNCLYVTHLDPNGFGNAYTVKAVEFDANY